MDSDFGTFLIGQFLSWAEVVYLIIYANNIYVKIQLSGSRMVLFFQIHTIFNYEKNMLQSGDVYMLCGMLITVDLTWYL